ncbi:glycosyltransferase family 4 protein [Diaminobutyricibacter tongyongensis]|uniref:Glycosyltransferase family 4 protein n=1 Tax=Leifsonia tongyongensis TaxID=1268043 RepID=A0A6L9XZZ2_9MICO|nr:glycosyltransferase family 4 protein [Diaminobutyricibacter tongyongensis]NEN07012.1 glycosyltransferase family 4 protein [Diaminobutyricibacter tongyongensis]
MGNPLKSLASAVARRAAANRHRLPRWVASALDWAIARPNSLIGALAYRVIGATDGTPSANPALDGETTRLYIGPANYAGQGREWAAAAQASREGTRAINMVVDVPGMIRFAADIEVPLRVYMGSGAWQKEQFEYVGRFTHCLVESGRPLFGGLFGQDAFAEAAALAESGVSVAMMCHGSDVRQHARHRENHRWSPYADRSLYSRSAERRATEFVGGLERFDGPVFVSTPDLLDDVPFGIWCPVVVDTERWYPGAAPMERDRPVVVHSPSSSAIKGSDLIEPHLRTLEDEGLIEYRRLEGVPWAQMPDIIRDADIVLDQFRIGSYGVAACEALSTGRVVVGQVADHVRARVEERTGSELPIIEANVETVGVVVRELLGDRDRARRVAADGQRFVTELHGGFAAAETLSRAWLGSDALRPGPGR